MTLHIIIHALAREINDLERVLDQLHKASFFIEEDCKVVIDCTLNLSDVLIDWNSSVLPKKYFEDRYKVIKNKNTWASKAYFDIEHSDNVLGCNDKRRNSIQTYSKETDYFMYLDSDVYFPPYILHYYFYALKQLNHEYTILTPEIPKLWDDSWNILANKKLFPLIEQWDKFNFFSLDKENFDLLSEISLKKLPHIKFAGSNLPVFSSNLLDLIKIPDSLGSYGLDDTFIMECSNYMKFKRYDIEQYVIENLVISENFLYRGKGFSPYTDLIKDITLNDDNDGIKNHFKQLAHKNYPIEIKKFIKHL